MPTICAPAGIGGRDVAGGAHGCPSRPPVAGGFPIIVCILAGSAAGFVYRQPTIGFFIGAAIGIAIAVALWLRDRR